MSNNNQAPTIRGLVKPQDDSLKPSIVTDVESLCTPFNFTCANGFSMTCSQFTDAGKDHDILF